MIVVADTSPLNYLVLLGHIDILAKIYAKVSYRKPSSMNFRYDAPAEFARGLGLLRAGCKSDLSSSG